MATDAQIQGALTGRYGPVDISHRFTFRDQLWNELGDLTTAIRNCDVSFDSTQLITRTINGTLDIPELQRLFPGQFTGQLVGSQIPGRWIGVQSQLYVAASGETLTYNRGLFKLSSHARLNLGENNIGTVEFAGLDPAILLLESPGIPYGIARGTNYITAITAILSHRGLTRFNISATPKTLPANMTWPVDTTWLEIINSLLQGINYWPLWFSGDGTAYSTYRGNPETTTFTVDATYLDDEPVFPIGDEFPRESDWERVPNEVTVTIETIERTPDGRTARNETSPPNGTELIGTVNAEKIVADAACDGDVLAELATWYVIEARSMATQISLNIQPDLRRDNTRALREIVAIKLGNWFEGVGAEPTRRYWHILSWKHDLSGPGNPMELRLASLLPGVYVAGDKNGPSGDTIIYPKVITT